ncbi:MAG: alpha/beta hydrolase, partial [Bacteroidota bacterium]
WGGMLATAYVGEYPEAVEKLVLAEPGPLSPELAKEFGAKFQPDVDWEFFSHMVGSYFKSLHVEEIDDQAIGDYFFREFTSNTELANNPMAGYFCNNDMSSAEMLHWRFSWTTYTDLVMTHMQGDFSGMTFGKDAKNFKNKTLILVGSCNVLVGEEFQKKQMPLFNDAEIVVIEDTGHFMFEEKPEECISEIKKYFNAAPEIPDQ